MKQDQLVCANNNNNKLAAIASTLVAAKEQAAHSVIWTPDSASLKLQHVFVFVNILIINVHIYGWMKHRGRIGRVDGCDRSQVGVR